ncbi:MAG TPA: hypothetical protein VM008_06255 [Phycisphaerae bacterium]|nr:hypothetical protein [Phycisphaerae bacterium]
MQSLALFSAGGRIEDSWGIPRLGEGFGRLMHEMSGFFRRKLAEFASAVYKVAKELQ